MVLLIGGLDDGIAGSLCIDTECASPDLPFSPCFVENMKLVVDATTGGGDHFTILLLPSMSHELKVFAPPTRGCSYERLLLCPIGILLTGYCVYCSISWDYCVPGVALGESVGRLERHL